MHHVLDTYQKSPDVQGDTSTNIFRTPTGYLLGQAGYEISSTRTVINPDSEWVRAHPRSRPPKISWTLDPLRIVASHAPN